MINCDIVIIDSGLNIGKGLLVPGVSIQRKDKVFSFSADLSDRIGHGTIIYSVIAKQVKKASFYIVKLPDFPEGYDESCLIMALEYIRDNVKCKIINMSLGINTGERIKELYDLCRQISAMGIVIVSAFDNNGSNSYPAAFDCVIGVDSKKILIELMSLNLLKTAT